MGWTLLLPYTGVGTGGLQFHFTGFTATGVHLAGSTPGLPQPARRGVLGTNVLGAFGLFYFRGPYFSGGGGWGPGCNAPLDVRLFKVFI